MASINILTTKGIKQTDKWLKKVANELSSKLELDVRKTARQTINYLKQITPKSKNLGIHLVDSWTTNYNVDYFSFEAIIGAKTSSKKYGIIHLLDKGHIIANQYGSYGFQIGNRFFSITFEKHQIILFNKAQSTIKKI